MNDIPDRAVGGSSEANEGARLELRLDLRAVANRVVWSPDGSLLAVAARNGTLSVFAPPERRPIEAWNAHGTEYVRDLAWHPDGTRLATCGDDGTVAVWEWPRRRLVRRVDLHEGWVLRLAWSPDGRQIAVSPHKGPVRVFSPSLSAVSMRVIRDSESGGLAWAPDSSRLAHGTKRGFAIVDRESLETVLSSEMGETSVAIAWSPDGSMIAAGGHAHFAIVPLQSPVPHTRIEGPDRSTFNVGFSPDGRILAAKGRSLVTLWRTDRWELVTTIQANGGSEASSGMAWRPDGARLALSSESVGAPSVWRLDSGRLLRAASQESAYYVTAKVALLGESGVGKTSLAHRIVTGEFQQYPSTHGQRFWVVPELAGPRADGAVCEAVLWDFAGQADYRLVHALLLDDVDLALLLFDPGSAAEPLKGIRYWLRQLHRQSAEVGTLLVGARMDRAAITLSSAELTTFCHENGISGGYVGTSAATGDGVDTLVQRVRDSIGWDRISPTITTATFKRIKDFILQLKSTAELSGIVPGAAALLAGLREAIPAHEFDGAEVAAAVAQLAKHGLVTPLRDAHGAEYVLLAPELLTSLASSVVLEVRRDPMELGTIDEQRLLAGEFAFPEVASLRPHERAVLLDSVVTLFVRRALCFREYVAGRSLLLFPALINQRIMAADMTESEDDATYIINGATENIYAALVVLLGYTNTFTRRSQWRGRAEYEMDEGELCGFRLAREEEGELEIVLYYGPTTPQPSRQLFQSQVERIISRRHVTFVRFGAVRCTEPSCGYVQDRGEVRKRVLEHRKYVFCSECGTRISFVGVADYSATPQTGSSLVDADERAAYHRTRYEEALVRLKALLRDRGQEVVPSCFISYAWGDAAHARRVRRLKDDLSKAGVAVLFDRDENSAIGSSIGRFVDSLGTRDYVIVVGTPAYLAKYENRAQASVVAAEMDLIFNRLLARESDKRTVLPVLLAGTPETSFPAALRSRVYAPIGGDEEYFSSVLDLILTMYQVPFDDPGVEAIRRAVVGPDEHQPLSMPNSPSIDPIS